MKITILQGAFYPVPAIQGGAVEKIWYRMGKEFATLGHEVVHIGRTHPKLPNTEIVNGVKYVRIPGYDTPSSLLKLKWLDLLYSRRAVKKIPKDADIIVTNTFWSPLILRGEIAKKVYVSVERWPKGQMKFYLHTGRLRGCSLSICDAVKKEIPSDLHDLVSYVPNPVPFDIKPTLKQKEKLILFVGRIHPEKGVHILIEAYKILEKKLGSEWKLIIVGPSDIKDGGGGADYLSNLKDLGSSSNIEFTGAIYDENLLIEYYAKSSIFCYPAQDNSGDAAPVAPREAMAYGCVPIVSKLSCFNDFIIESVNGFMFDQKSDVQANELAEKISTLIKNKDLLITLSENSRKVNNKFSSKVIAQQFIKDFEATLANTISQ